MDHDLSQLLGDWPFEHGRINVRVIHGDDDSPKMQIRVQLGVLQLDLVGRPDGIRPHDHESLLDLQLDRLHRYTEENGSTTGFVLSPEECSDLREEAVLYYHRYVGLFVIERFEEVERDTTRNLRVLDLCRDHAAADNDRSVMEVTRPHILTMRCRAQASRAIAESDSKLAMRLIDAGLQEVQRALLDMGFGDRINESNDIQLLSGMRDALVPKLPTSERVELQERLRSAISAENYELASILRDELRMMTD